jgi:hypothetical protein
LIEKTTVSRHVGAVLGAFVLTALAACGTTQVTTVTKTVVSRPTSYAAPPARHHKHRQPYKASRAAAVPGQPQTNRFTACDQNISAKAATTTCHFAENTFYEYWTSSESSDITVYSPATARDFATTCTPGEDWVVCTTADGGVVRFTQAAVDRYTASEAARYAATADIGSGADAPSNASSPAPPSPSDSGPNPSNEIPNYANGTGYPVQCADGMWSDSGGRPGACSHHGGVG